MLIFGKNNFFITAISLVGHSVGQNQEIDARRTCALRGRAATAG
jgi:hypothetical protein